MGRLPGIRHRNLGEYEIAYLFVDGIAERIRPGAEARAGAGRLVLYGIWRQSASASDGGFQGGSRDGERLLPGHARPRARRSAARRVRPGSRHHEGIETCFPRSEHQRCLAHRMRVTAGPSSRPAPPPPLRPSSRAIAAIPPPVW